MNRRISQGLTKRLVLNLFIISLGLSCSLKAYPVEDPEEGHSRPGWWWSVYYNDVFIVKGTIETHDIVDSNPGSLKKLELLDSLYFVKARADADHKPAGQYVMGKLKVIETLHISKALTGSDSIAQQLSSGKMLALDVLIQAYKIPDAYMPGSGFDNKKNQAKFQAKYSSNDKAGWFMITPKMLLGMPSYYITHKISSDNLKEIKDIIEFRKKKGDI